MSTYMYIHIYVHMYTCIYVHIYLRAHHHSHTLSCRAPPSLPVCCFPLCLYKSHDTQRAGACVNACV